MWIVYVLYSQTFNKIYIGFTSDLSGRMKAHNELATKGWTIRFRPWSVVHYEIFEIKMDGLRREKQLKTAKGRKWIWELIRNS